jgi:hypothetical protein
VRAFTVYVRPILEYVSVIWSPYLIKDIKLIGAVQKRFIKRLPNLNRVTYEERLKILGLQSLELRRLQNDLITVYKILFDKMDVEPNFLKANCNSITRGHSYKLFLPYCRCDVRKHFFNNRIAQPWNELMLTDDNLRSLSCFKTFIRNADLSKYLRVFFQVVHKPPVSVNLP